MSHTNPKPYDSKPCEWGDCEHHGDYKAPKSAAALRDYFWFCLKHVREYNAKWDFFSGYSPEDIHHFQTESIIGHRPTWKRHNEHASHAEDIYVKRLKEKIAELFGEHHRAQSKKNPAIPPISPPEKAALGTLGLSLPTTKDLVKRRYKQLAKLHHPDVNPTPQAKEDFQRLAEAYRILAESALLA
jgi:hypothetical protein